MDSPPGSRSFLVGRAQQNGRESRRVFSWWVSLFSHQGEQRSCTSSFRVYTLRLDFALPLLPFCLAALPLPFCRFRFAASVLHHSLLVFFLPLQAPQERL